jgi:hypothetical protein
MNPREAVTFFLPKTAFVVALYCEFLVSIEGLDRRGVLEDIAVEVDAELAARLQGRLSTHMIN